MPAIVRLLSALRSCVRGHARARVARRVPRPEHTSMVAGVNPIGVVGRRAPWNYPLIDRRMESLRPALAGGNTVVLKPL